MFCPVFTAFISTGAIQQSVTFPTDYTVYQNSCMNLLHQHSPSGSDKHRCKPSFEQDNTDEQNVTCINSYGCPHHNTSTVGGEGGDSVILQLSLSQTTSCAEAQGQSEGVCLRVSMSVYVSVRCRVQIQGTICSNFPFLGSNRKANTFFFFLPHTPCFTISLFITAQNLWRWADLNPKFPALTHAQTHTHTQIHRFGCVRVFTSVCILPRQTLVTRGHWQCLNRAGLR